MVTYFFENRAQIWSLLLEHIELTFFAVALAIIIGIPIGILISYIKKLNKPILGLASIFQAIPSMALLGFMIPFLGIGRVPAIVVVVLYSLLPIIKNTATGISGISDTMIESAKGIGLTNLQILFKIQIPQALPIIMAGVRISAVSAVGLMTMAAFIGGGGLGYLIFSGIRTVNNNQILAGAIPACLLALFVDYLFSIVERLVTPVALQLKGKNKEKVLKARRKDKVILIVFIILFAIFLISKIDFHKESASTLTVASKDFTEQNILCELSSIYLANNTNIKINKQCNLGGAQVVFQALERDDIDFYIDYLGTDYTDILKYEPISNVNKVYQTVKDEFASKYQIAVLSPMSFNNTYSLAVTKDLASKYNLKTISDLAKVSKDLTISPTLEFVNRNDGLPGLLKAYNLEFKNTIAMDGSPRYTALLNNNSQVIDAFTTDGLLRKFNLTVLEDDKNFFPPYYAVPLLKQKTLEKYPEVENLMSKLVPYLTDDVMQEMNYQVDEVGKNPEEVAKEFLLANNLIEK